MMTLERYTFLFSTIAVLGIGCAPEVSAPVSRQEAADMQKSHETWDLCEDYGWYGDGICDEFCLWPDPDCTAGDECTVGDDSTCPPGETCTVGYCYFYCPEGDTSCCEPATCEPLPYDPCGARACGDRCSQCPPDDPGCVETAVLKFCQPDGTCAAAEPVCAPEECEIPLCAIYCPYGYETDENGCDICSCAEPPACLGAFIDETGTCRSPDDGVYPDSCCFEDCRETGCGDGQWCSFCWGSYQCIPDGALC